MEKLLVGGVEVEVGDIILVRSKRVLSYLIRLFMKIYRNRLGLSKDTSLYNHAAMLIQLWGNWYVAEALAEGITIRPFKETYQNTSNDIALLRAKQKYTPIEKSILSKYVCSFALNPTRYDVVNFFYQVKMIIHTTSTKIGKWYGKEGEEAKKRLYCSEAVAWWTNKNRNIFENPASVNPLDIYINDGLEILYEEK